MLETGDVIVVSGNSWISNQIKNVVGTPWTHVALYVGAGRVLEIDWNTRATLAPEEYVAGELDCVVMRSKKPLTEVQRRQLFQLALAYQDQGSKYDWHLLLSMFLEKKFPKIKWPFDSQNDYICTELTDDILSAIGLQLFPGHEGNIYPHDFIDSPALAQVQLDLAAAN